VHTILSVPFCLYQFVQYHFVRSPNNVVQHSGMFSIMLNIQQFEPNILKYSYSSLKKCLKTHYSKISNQTFMDSKMYMAPLQGGRYSEALRTPSLEKGCFQATIVINI